jgi:hypothetical protein
MNKSLEILSRGGIILAAIIVLVGRSQASSNREKNGEEAASYTWKRA